MQATMSPQTSILGVELACDKEGTNASLLMLECRCQRHGHQLLGRVVEAMEAVGYPIVRKPLDGNHGRASPLILDPGQRQS